MPVGRTVTAAGFLALACVALACCAPKPSGTQDLPVNAQETSRIDQDDPMLPCLLSPEEHGNYAHDPGGKIARLPFPNWLIDKHVTGCAGIEYQIDADGRAVNFRTIKEYPANSGIDRYAIDVLKASHFAPETDPLRRYYWPITHTSTMHVRRF